MRDPELHSSTWEWDNVCPSRQWRKTHNFEHHTWTNVRGLDRDIGYGILRVEPEQAWRPEHLAQPAIFVLLALLFEYGVALHDLRFDPRNPPKWEEVAPTLTETGRKSGGRMRPFPWAINREGKGYWFKSREEALAFAEDSVRQGRQSFDVGCVQINYRWHGHAFPSLNDMFDPEWTATYAGQFLRTLYEERGDWSAAAAISTCSRSRWHTTSRPPWPAAPASSRTTSRPWASSVPATGVAPRDRRPRLPATAFLRGRDEPVRGAR